jgi:hypothetical protein
MSPPLGNGQLAFVSHDCLPGPTQQIGLSAEHRLLPQVAPAASPSFGGDASAVADGAASGDVAAGEVVSIGSDVSPARPILVLGRHEAARIGTVTSARRRGW